VPDRREACPIDALEAWGYSLDHPPADGATLDAGRVLHRTVSAGEPARGGREGGKADPALLRAARAFRDATAKLGTERRPGALRSPSDRDRLPEPPESTSGERGPAGGQAAPDRAVARAAGTAIHLLLEVWDRERDDADWLFEAAPRAASVAARGEVDAGAVAARTRAILEGARRTGALERIREERALGREVPMLLAVDGEVWEGTMDLVAGSPDAPEVVDYKTEGRADPAAHEGQLGTYREALRRALGLPEPPPGRIQQV
jgi:ATP-dependent exoDNAse (exonuclease V) beta subunit